MDNNVNNNGNGGMNNNNMYNNYGNGADNRGMDNNYGMNNIPPQKKSSKLMKILVPVIAAAAVLAVVCVANASGIKRFFTKIFGSGTEYYKSIERDNLEMIADRSAMAYDNIKYVLGDLSNKTYSYNMDVRLEDGAQPYMGMLGSYTGYDFGWAGQAGITADIISDNGVYGINGRININDVDIASVNAVYSSDNREAYFGVPELSDKQAVVPADAGVDVKGVVDTIDSLFNELPEDSTVRELIVRYGTAILDSVEEVNTEDTELAAEGISQACTAYTVELDNDTLTRMCLDVFNALKTDKDVELILTKNVDAVQKILAGADASVFGDLSESMKGISGAEVYNNFISSIDELIKALEEKDGDNEVQGKIVTYINSDGAITGRTIDVGDIKVEYAMPLDGKDFGLEFAMYTSDTGMDTPLMKVTGKGTISDGIMDCECEVSGTGMTAVAYSMKDIDLNAAAKGETKGIISYDLGSIMSEAGVSGMEGLGVDLVMDCNREKYNTDIVIRFNSTSLATVSISCGIGAAKKLEVPAPGDTVTLNSEEEIMEWVSAMKFDEVTASLEKAGVDSKIMDVINQYTALLSMGM